MAKDPYSELGVSRGASHDEIRKAFRKLAKQLHPDQNPGDKAAEERFKRVSAAFDILGDEDKRKKFDRGEIDADGREQFRGPPPGGRGGFQGGGGGFGQSFEGVDLDDIFSMFGQGGGGGFGAGRPRGPTKGQDVRATFEVSLEDAIAGATRRIAFSDGRTLDVTIPKGAVEGQVLRLKGQGAPGRAGNGDALIELALAKHPVFRREGADLYLDLPVSVPDAVLGGKVQVRTPEGTVSMTLPKGSNSGASLRLKGRGATAAGGRRGDLFARVQIMLPETDDADLIRFAEDWRVRRPYSPGSRNG